MSCHELIIQFVEKRKLYLKLQKANMKHKFNKKQQIKFAFIQKCFFFENE
jgi:hypothetical protein